MGEKMIKIRPVLLATLAICLGLGMLSSPTMAAKSYYKWVDENGVTHYSARKPHDKESEAISVTTGLSRDDSDQPSPAENSAQADAASTSEDPAAEDPEANKDPERCEIAKSNLKILNESARIREATEDGSFRYLSDDEKGQRKETAQQAITESC